MAEQQVFPTWEVLACVALGKDKNPLVHPSQLTRLICFLTGESMLNLQTNLQMFCTYGVIAGIGLAKYYPDLEAVDYHDDYGDKAGIDAWYARHLASLGGEMMIETFRENLIFTDEERAQAANTSLALFARLSARPQ